MLLLTHVVVAIISIIFTTVVYVKPSENKLRVSFALAAFTLISGTYMILKSPAHLVQSCITGIIYIGVVTLFILLAKRKLAIS